MAYALSRDRQCACDASAAAATQLAQCIGQSGTSKLPGAATNSATSNNILYCNVRPDKFRSLGMWWSVVQVPASQLDSMQVLPIGFETTGHVRWCFTRGENSRHWQRTHKSLHPDGHPPQHAEGQAGQGPIDHQTAQDAALGDSQQTPCDRGEEMTPTTLCSQTRQRTTHTVLKTHCGIAAYARKHAAHEAATRRVQTPLARPGTRQAVSEATT